MSEQAERKKKKRKREPAQVIARAEPGEYIPLPEHVTSNDGPIQRPTFSTTRPAKEDKEGGQRVRGPSLTPKQEMRVPRDADNHTWNRCFKALCAKWDQTAYTRRSETK